MKKFQILSSTVIVLFFLGTVSSASADNDDWEWKSFETRKDSHWQQRAVEWLEGLRAEAENVRCNLFEGHKFFLWAKKEDDSGHNFKFVTRSWSDSDWPDTIAEELEKEEATPCGFNLQGKVWVLKKL